MVYRSSRAPANHGGGIRPHNVFRNDGSFLEMFKRMQDQQRTTSAAPSDDDDGVRSSSETRSPPPGSSSSRSPPPRDAEESVPRSPPSSSNKTAAPKAPFVGKRRGGRVLPTGKVKRLKPESETPEEIPTDAWSAYLAEVKRYKETTCEEDGKTRPLVK